MQVAPCRQKQSYHCFPVVEPITRAWVPFHDASLAHHPKRVTLNYTYDHPLLCSLCLLGSGAVQTPEVVDARASSSPRTPAATTSTSQENAMNHAAGVAPEKTAGDSRVNTAVSRYTCTPDVLCRPFCLYTKLHCNEPQGVLYFEFSHAPLTSNLNKCRRVCTRVWRLI